MLEKSNLFEQAVLVQDVRFLITDRTIYSRIGDLVAWLSLAFAAAALLASWKPEPDAEYMDVRSRPRSRVMRT